MFRFAPLSPLLHPTPPLCSTAPPPGISIGTASWIPPDFVPRPLYVLHSQRNGHARTQRPRAIQFDKYRSAVVETTSASLEIPFNNNNDDPAPTRVKRFGIRENVPSSKQKPIFILFFSKSRISNRSQLKCVRM